jgi:hypothetical protein
MLTNIPIQQVHHRPMPQSYTFRLNAFTPKTTASLGDDGFTFAAADAPGRTYSYEQISAVRLSYEPSRASGNIFFCRIYVKGQRGPAASISSTTYRGFLDFEPQFDSYLAFVAALHARLAAHGSKVSYRAGVSAFAYWGNAAFLTIVGVFSVMLLAPIIGDANISATSWFRIEMILALLPVVFLWFWSNRPRPYDPKDIPGDVLPKA